MVKQDRNDFPQLQEHTELVWGKLKESCDDAMLNSVGSRFDSWVEFTREAFPQMSTQEVLSQLLYIYRLCNPGLSLCNDWLHPPLLCMDEQ